VVLESHGLFTWGDTPKEMLRNDNRHHQQGDRLVREEMTGQAALRRTAAKSLEPAERRRIAARLMPKSAA
jgi:rhamnose utilization protein RhaD (predicted bifunctional aldolase and dehydrogenase)